MGPRDEIHDCGLRDCRTLQVDGNTYEEIPTELMIRTGFTAASELELDLTIHVTGVSFTKIS